MEKFSSTEVNELENQSKADVTLVKCKTEPGEGTTCAVDGKEISGDIVEAIEKGKKVAEERGARAYFHNKSLNVFWPLEKFIKSCPKLAQKMDLSEKFEWIKISAIIAIIAAFLVFLWIAI